VAAAQPSDGGDKHERGTVLVVGGAVSTPGALVLGPGLLDVDGAGELLRAVLPRLDATPVVLDGLALRALDPALLSELPAVLTPNASELEALVGEPTAEGLDAAVAAARRHHAVVCAPGWVAAPDGRTWCIEAGGIGLGTSGSGDVLAGLVGGALARGADPAQAAVWGQYLHAAAGDLLTARLGRVGFLARELLDEVPVVLGQLRP
jgi:ADP-dependent NAD(P)H-hydrate dehydratase